MLQPPSGPDWVGLSTDPIPIDAAVAWATTASSGAVVTFVGVVRDQAEGRAGVHAMTYEAYEKGAERVLAEVATEARRRWPAVCRLVLLHRVGDLGLSEVSVVIVASGPHRTESFEAARFCIDTLKETAPIWKREHWTDGSDWALGEHPIRPVSC